ncbi:LacI family DNA-binding transcriptional regulator [Amnibacterium sp.]|uniref:LacI family DNA-binding transcriptional regulator n=1 Tax=Amnibacterium sp. TaxID=1872496 RepID=UPI0026252A74|nr:LacI family DNA-binding transcriptional regulator [Amnibacterium sp.]MCU1473090.1 transcriptional regulator [Amnibacterium sp.]
MRRQPTVTDVASAAGVSRQTVSNVLNTPQIVRAETRERVERAIASLHYRPHASARRLRTRQSETIAVRLDPVTDGISGSLLDRFLHALAERAGRAGFRVLLYTAADEPAEIAQFGRLLDGADVDAFVLTSTHHGDTRIDWLIEHDVPFVTFGRPWGVADMTDPEHLWVDVDGRHGLTLATGHVLDRGARRVAFLGWPAGSGTGDDRRAGWRSTMEARTDLSRAELDVLDLAVEEDPTDGSIAARLVATIDPAPDAIVCASDSLALGARLALGDRVPIVGYDDTPVARALGLSSVAQQLDEVAEGVLDLLIGAHRGRAGGAEGVDDPQHRLVKPRLVVR